MQVMHFNLSKVSTTILGHLIYGCCTLYGCCSGFYQPCPQSVRGDRQDGGKLNAGDHVTDFLKYIAEFLLDG